MPRNPHNSPGRSGADAEFDGKVEAALHMSEEHFKLLVDSAREFAFVTLDAEGRISGWNSGAERMFQYSQDEAVGQPANLIFTPKDVEEDIAEAEIERARTDGMAEDERWHARKNGEHFWASGVLHAIYSEPGKIKGFIKVVRDSTDAKRMEIAMRDSEERLRLLVENVDDYAILMAEKDCRIILSNPAACQILGYTDGELQEAHFSILFTNEDREQGIPEKELLVAASEGRAKDERWHRRKDGSQFWAQGMVYSVQSNQGVRGFVKILRDMTTRKLEEDAVRESEERYRLLLNNIHEYAVIELDLQGKVSAWNEGARKLKGYREEEILGEHLSIFYPPEYVAQGVPVKLVERSLREGHATHEGWRIRKDGSRFWAHVTLVALRRPDGSARALFKLVHDISHRKRIEDELHAIQAELESRVEQRTSELKRMNETLQDQVQERRRVEAALRRSEQQVRTLVQSLDDVVFTLDLNETIDFLEGRGLQSFESDAQSALHQTVRQALGPEAYALHQEKISQVRQGQSLIYEGPLPCKEDCLFLFSLAPLRSDGNEIVGVVGVIRDVTELKRLQKQVVEVGELERQRLGSDLHDSLGQHLTGASMILEAARQEVSKGRVNEMPGLLESAARGIREAAEEARQLSHGLFPKSFETRDFGVVLREMVQDFCRNRANCHLQLPETICLNETEKRLHIYRILQEALNNAIRHGQPENIWVTLKQDDKGIVLEVANDGQPFSGIKTEGSGIGFQTMQYRTDLMGGTLHIGPRTEGGAVLVCRIPCAL